MIDNTKEILPGWTLRMDELTPGVGRITLTDRDGRKAEIVDTFNDSILDKCSDYAFEIEKQTKRPWNKFLYDFATLRLKKIKIQKKSDGDFGSWTIQAKSKRLHLDGRAGRLTYEERQAGDWLARETIKDFKRVTLEQFMSFTNRIK